MSETRDVPVIGELAPWRIRSEMGVKGERRLESLVAKVVAAVAAQGFGRSLMEGVYLAGFEHGATFMERKMQPPGAKDESAT